MLPETPRIPGSLPELLGVTSCVTYMQQYGASAYERSDNKKGTLPIYRQLVRWFWGSLGRDIRVTLPSSAVNCIRPHFQEPEKLEDEMEYTGFHHADE